MLLVSPTTLPPPHSALPIHLQTRRDALFTDNLRPGTATHPLRMTTAPLIFPHRAAACLKGPTTKRLGAVLTISTPCRLRQPIQLIQTLYIIVPKTSLLRLNVLAAM